MENYELAFRMQMQVPGVLDLESEDARHAGHVRDRPGHDRRVRPQVPARAQAGRAGRAVRAALRRLVGQPRLYRTGPRQPGRRVDQPIAALITDLKQRGLLDETLVVWCGEFGRSPDNGVRGGTAVRPRSQRHRP